MSSPAKARIDSSESQSVNISKCVTSPSTRVAVSGVVGGAKLAGMAAPWDEAPVTRAHSP